MSLQEILTNPSTWSDWIAPAVQQGLMLNPTEVAKVFGYKSRSAFNAFCRRENLPRVKLGARCIRIPAADLNVWVADRLSPKDRKKAKYEC